MRELLVEGVERRSLVEISEDGEVVSEDGEVSTRVGNSDSDSRDGSDFESDFGSDSESNSESDTSEGTTPELRGLSELSDLSFANFPEDPSESEAHRRRLASSSYKGYLELGALTLSGLPRQGEYVLNEVREVHSISK
jgi:hypothetical protein